MPSSQDVIPDGGAPPETSPSDRSLLRRWRNHEQDAATQLYLRYAHRLRALVQTHRSADLARRVEVEDLVQSIFASFFRGVNQGYYDVPPGEELWKLILVIALNKLRAQGNFHRAAKRDIRLTAGGDALADAAERDSDADAGALTVLRLVIDEVLEQLLPFQREMVVLRIEGHEVADIAAQTRRSKRTVERVLQDFRRRLADVLG
jgi:RNA polymerase sigma-70 factor (ECF subfamily)